MNQVITPNTVTSKQEQWLNRLTSLLAVFAVAIFLFSPDVAMAQSIDLPWETFTQKLACTLTGAWLKWMAVIAVALAGVLWGVGELSGPFQRVMQIASGFSIAIAAVAVVGWLLPAGAGIAQCGY